ncbi:MAG TPA: HIT domain-containing protein, partial [Candidatus Limnocylindria bacterium]|nr:HIT domain-containing protein [Candidatus Limnocylindria bacterium]
MGLANADCVFCRIVAHEAPATIRFEDDDLVAFDGEPKATPFHVLVVPRRHIRSVAELTDIDLAGRLVLTAARIAKDAGVTSFRLATNAGAPLQDVFHLHWHVMAGDKMGHPAGIAFSR